MDLSDFEYLLTGSGQRLLAVAMSSYADRDTLSLSRRLRSLHGGYSAGEVASAMTQVVLRRAAREKFADAAAVMYFTPAGLEQATHPVVAAHRADRAGGGPHESALDLGCGVGSDLIAFARGGCSVVGVDSDPLTARIAAANLQALRIAGTVYEADAEATDASSFDVVFVDPARRVGSTRVFAPQAFSPPWNFVADLLARPTTPGRRDQQVIAKLAPGLDHRFIPRDVEASWVSLDGELKEVMLCAPPPGAARRRATLLTKRGGVTSRSDRDLVADPEVRDCGACVYEPDPALIRSHLVAVAVAELDGWLLDRNIAYICSDAPVQTPLATGYRVVDVLPFKEKPLRAALRARNVGTLTIKKRGVAITPEDLRQRLALRGDVAATIILTRTPKSAVALLVEPLD